MALNGDGCRAGSRRGWRGSEDPLVRVPGYGPLLDAVRESAWAFGCQLDDHAAGTAASEDVADAGRVDPLDHVPAEHLDGAWEALVERAREALVAGHILEHVLAELKLAGLPLFWLERLERELSTTRWTRRSSRRRS